MSGAFSVQKVILFYRTRLRRCGTLQTVVGGDRKPETVGGCVDIGCLGAVVVLHVAACGSLTVVAIVLSIDTSCFVACSPIFRGQSPPAAASRSFGCRINAEDDIVPKVTSASASGRGSIDLVLFSKISFSLLLMFFDSLLMFWGHGFAMTLGTLTPLQAII
ncbi:hypothetical protein LZ32DRAFT_134707 [Colletotrichum eremochloae]|nr:hypothetical protein LZ32DRAFT_134707 [Colletotrichum eremochloae]